MKVQNGQNVQVHYKGTLKDGTEFDNSRRRGQSASFEVGSRALIRGFSNAVVGMAVGETRSVTLEADEAYGERDPLLKQTIPKPEFGPDFEFILGGTIQGRAPTGQPFLAKIEEIRDDDVVLDLNHPLAGEQLTFEIELLSVDGSARAWAPTMKKAELLEVAKGHGLSVNTRSTKAQIIEALSA
jgi:FKBP-type peptidyl-prolyl cis-trans isomerase 2